MEEYIRKIPKIELHVHLEGTLEPELLFKFAERNKVEIPFKSYEEVRKAYDSLYDLNSFLDLYYQGTNVLRTESDFYDLTFNYLKRCHEKENVVHVEPFFDPQVHTKKGILFQTILNGIYRALLDGEAQFGITFRLIMCFIRDSPLETAIACYTEALPIVKSGQYPNLVGIGLDSDEMGYPPSKFQKLYELAKSDGFRLCGHGGHDGPPSPYVWELLNSLNVQRIDHGITSVQDEELMKRLKTERIPLTVCPVSNVKIGPIPSLKEHPLKKMVDYGLLVSINSDDPAYLQSYISDVFLEITKVWNFTKEDITAFVRNSIESSFMDESQKLKMYERLDNFVQVNK